MAEIIMKSENPIRVYLLGPVRGIPKELDEFFDSYVSFLEKNNYKVYYPKRDTNQKSDDLYGVIFPQNGKGIIDAQEIHVFWQGLPDNKISKGSFADFGMVLMSEYVLGVNKKIYLINYKDVISKNPSKKSLEGVLVELHNKYNLSSELNLPDYLKK